MKKNENRIAWAGQRGKQLLPMETTTEHMQIFPLQRPRQY